MNFLANIAYDGTHYFGWQKTTDLPSIQGALAQAIAKASQEEVLPESASRTDRGVHAEGQVCAFTLQKEWDLRELLKALNAYLPKDIRVTSIKVVPEYFHPTLEALGKEYHYKVSTDFFQEPMDRLYAWHFPKALNINLMEKAALEITQMRDFSAFSTDPKNNAVCTLSSIEFATLPRGRLQIALTGDRFLYKMARTVAGTLLYIGCGKLPPDCIPHIFSSLDRKKAGVTAPAHGLFLHRVIY